VTGARAAALVVIGVVLSGCGTFGASAQDYAGRACDAYRETARDQVASTKAQADAVVEVARSDVRAAAAFDPRWEALSADMQSALELRGTGADRFFRVDRRVQGDCQDAGRDIGDLEP
jgi:hypothetical protein